MFRYIRSPCCGYILTELVAVLAIIVVLGCTGVASYVRYIDQARLIRARFDLSIMASALDIYYVENMEYPANPSLAGIGWPHIGPWGEACEYRGGDTEYTITVRDGEGRKRAEARGDKGVSEVVEVRQKDGSMAVGKHFLRGMGAKL